MEYSGEKKIWADEEKVKIGVKSVRQLLVGR